MYQSAIVEKNSDIIILVFVVLNRDGVTA